ncbi:hypothetical protein ACLB2K_072563 [Fragaria x ananassa]
MWRSYFWKPKNQFLFLSPPSPDLFPLSHLLRPIFLSSGHQTGRHRSCSVHTDLLSISRVVSLAVALPGSRHVAEELLQYRWKTGDFSGVSDFGGRKSDRKLPFPATIAGAISIIWKLSLPTANP